jgi:hypothetical protein
MQWVPSRNPPQPIKTGAAAALGGFILPIAALSSGPKPNMASRSIPAAVFLLQCTFPDHCLADEAVGTHHLGLVLAVEFRVGAEHHDRRVQSLEAAHVWRHKLPQDVCGRVGARALHRTTTARRPRPGHTKH